MSLWLVRHAKPLIASGTCYGALDVSADAQQTEAAAKALAKELPQAIRVEVSPLMRCQQLAQALARLRTDLQFSINPNLREMDFGCWEGMAWNDIPRAAMEDWTQDFSTHRFGGSESAGEVLARVATAWDAVHNGTGADVLWISHAGVARAAVLLQQGIRQPGAAKDWPILSLAYGAWMKFE